MNRTLRNFIRPSLREMPDNLHGDPASLIITTWRPCVTRYNWEFAKEGAKTYRAIFVGGKRAIKCPLQGQFWRPQKWDSSGLCLFPVRKMTGHEQRGGKRIISGGVQIRFGGGALWYVFPSPESPPLLFFSDITNFSCGCCASKSLFKLPMGGL